MKFLPFNRSSTLKNHKNNLTSKNIIPNLKFYDDSNSSNHKIYEEKLKKFLEDIKLNRIKYQSLKILFEYEDNFKLVCDIYKKYIKSKLEMEVLNFYLKSLDNFISLIHSDEPMIQLDKILNTVNKYLRVKTFNKNSILFKIGDFGTKYFILLKGKACTLVPRKLVKAMTFDEYRNHLNFLFILGEDYLLEKTMHSNIQSCDIAYSEIDSNDNRILRDIYLKNYTCPYDKYIIIIIGDENAEIENFDDISSSSNDESKEEEKEKEKDFKENYNDEKKEEDRNNKDKDSNSNEKDEIDKSSENIGENTEHQFQREHHLYHVKKLKIKKNKYIKALKYFRDNFELRKDKEDRFSIDSIYSELELIDEEEQNLLDSNNNLNAIKKKLKTNLKSIKNKENKKKEEKNKKEENELKIGIPSELIINKRTSGQIHLYDAGELPTFFTRNRKNYIYYNDNEKEDKPKDDDKNKKKIKNNQYFFNHVLNLRRNLSIVGYTNVGEFTSGMGFGEISLLKENHKRTSTIFIQEDSQLGRLNLGEYNITIKTVRTKLRTDSINFLLQTKLFGDISYLYFLSKYWIYFQCKKVHKGDFLFKIGDICDSVYIIYSGEIKLSSYIDKDNIDDLINSINDYKTKKIQTYIHKQNKKYSNNNTNSIFERKQKYCLMIGKKGDIIGLDDIINYKNNKYICEAEVTSDYLSYYEISKGIIFNQNENNKASIGDTLNIENMYNIIKTKSNFMIKKLKNIKMTIKQRFKFFNDDNTSYEDNKVMINKLKLNKRNENKNTFLNKNKKTLSLNSLNAEKDKTNDNNINNISKEKIIFSSSFLKNDIIKEKVNNLYLSHNSFNKKNKMKKIIILSNNNNNTANSSINSKIINFSKTTNNSPAIKTIINLNPKNNINLKNIIKENKIREKKKFIFEINKNSNNNSINNKSINTNNTFKIDENENSKKIQLRYGPCKAYEFPRIHDENKVEANNWDTFRKNKILKFLFLNEDHIRFKILKYYKVKKNSFNNNYFFNTIRNNSLKNNNLFESESIDKNNSKNKNYYNLIKEMKEKIKFIYKSEKHLSNPIKSSITNDYSPKKEKSLDIIINNHRNSQNNSPNSKNKNCQVNNINPEKKEFLSQSIKNFEKKQLEKHFYFSSNNKHKKRRLKITSNLLPNIGKTKN